MRFLKNLFLPAILLVLPDCYSGFERYQNYEPYQLSNESIKDFQLTIEELSLLQFFLTDSLILQRGTSSLEKKFMDDLTVEAQPRRITEIVLIPPKKPGIAVRIYKRWQDENPSFRERLTYAFARSRNDIILRVCFGDDPNQFLTFEPNENGVYVLSRLENGNTLHGDKEYSCENDEIGLYFLAKKYDDKVEVVISRPPGRRLIRLNPD